MDSFGRVLFIYDRNLRLDNHPLLNQCLDYCSNHSCEVLFLYIWDEEYLWPYGCNVFQSEFLKKALVRLRENLKRHHVNLCITEGDRLKIITHLIQNGGYHTLFIEQSHSPSEMPLIDRCVKSVESIGGKVFTSLGNWLFSIGDIVTQKGTPMKKYTSFMKQGVKLFEENKSEFKCLLIDSESLSWGCLNSVHEIGFGFKEMKIGEEPLIDDFVWTKQMLIGYEENRNYPFLENGVSGIGPYLRFGIISVVELAIASWENSRTMWNELVWREFFSHWYWSFPNTAVSNFNPLFDNMAWVEDDSLYERWQKGVTGFPLVDAGMRSLIQTGKIHNRVRMVVASFLCKDLHIDWRKGEQFFAQYLLDYEPASNVGNWQWVAGCGVDAAPYFRVFNPVLQLEKFDPKRKYVNRWLSDDYDLVPMVDHKKEKEKALALYDQIRGK
ncbi:MAG: DNA photolyase family protein [Prolixibacteraceae bacterium]|jgi:deoxyribodipyrimidine photo-lyase|nr:DNA photolyase family protein [Prolixibacteraceae bacterium]